MTPEQFHQLEWMQRCLLEARAINAQTDAERSEFQALLVRQKARDEIARNTPQQSLAV